MLGIWFPGSPESVFPSDWMDERRSCISWLIVELKLSLELLVSGLYPEEHSVQGRTSTSSAFGVLTLLRATTISSLMASISGNAISSYFSVSPVSVLSFTLSTTSSSNGMSAVE